MEKQACQRCDEWFECENMDDVLCIKCCEITSPQLVRKIQSLTEQLKEERDRVSCMEKLWNEAGEMLMQEYALWPDEKLTPAAIELKKKIIASVVNPERKPKSCPVCKKLWNPDPEDFIENQEPKEE